LRLKTINALGFTTIYYYDAARQLRFSINASGSVKELGYTSFKEIANVRSYANPLLADITQPLEGGFLTPELLAIFKNLSDDKQDEIVTLTYNKRGLVVTHIDATKAVTTQTYTAFKEIEQENLPVKDKTPSLFIKHQYNIRGDETATLKIADAKEILV